MAVHLPPPPPVVCSARQVLLTATVSSPQVDNQGRLHATFTDTTLPTPPDNLRIESDGSLHLNEHCGPVRIRLTIAAADYNGGHDGWSWPSFNPRRVFTFADDNGGAKTPVDPANHRQFCGFEAIAPQRPVRIIAFSYANYLNNGAGGPDHPVSSYGFAMTHDDGGTIDWADPIISNGGSHVLLTRRGVPWCQQARYRVHRIRHR